MEKAKWLRSRLIVKNALAAALVQILAQ